VKLLSLLAALGASGLLAGSLAQAEISVVIDHNDRRHANAAFTFETVPQPSPTNAATKASFRLLEGERDEHGGELDVLHNGKLPDAEDQPAASFSFKAGTHGGRIVVDLGRVMPLEQINTYSWHSGVSGPQVYKLYASDGKAAGFNARPQKGPAPRRNGWKLLASVDTRPKRGEWGGQYGVSISDSAGPLGDYRYLLFDLSRTESKDAWGNTCYSAIDVIRNMAAPLVMRSADGYCQISIDSSREPELWDWADQELAPVLAEWYPQLTTLLASDGFKPPQSFKVILQPGPLASQNWIHALTDGTLIRADSTWLKSERNAHALGCLVHEEAHVVQQYAHWQRVPNWLKEGIPEYLRAFKYEPERYPADAASFSRNGWTHFDSYTAGPTVCANFLNYVFTHYDKGQNLLARINAACREAKYQDDLWKQYTGKTLGELNGEWMAALRTQMGEPLTFPATIEGKEYQLEAMIYRPNDSAVHPFIVMNHGRFGMHPARNPNEARNYVELNCALASHGYIVMMLVRRGYGNSQGPDSELKDTAIECGLEAVKDIQCAVAYLRQQPYVDKDRGLVMGHSQGGWAALAASTVRMEGVRGTVNLAGGTNYRKMGDGKITPTVQTNYVDSCRELGKAAVVPTLWIYVENDVLNPPACARRMCEAFQSSGGQAQLVISPPYGSNGHYFTQEPGLFMTELLQFFARIGLSNPEPAR
jgi:dienelactone hydrolase